MDGWEQVGLLWFIYLDGALLASFIISKISWLPSLTHSTRLFTITHAQLNTPTLSSLPSHPQAKAKQRRKKRVSTRINSSRNEGFQRFPADPKTNWSSHRLKVFNQQKRNLGQVLTDMRNAHAPGMNVNTTSRRVGVGLGADLLRWRGKEREKVGVAENINSAAEALREQAVMASRE